MLETKHGFIGLVFIMAFGAFLCFLVDKAKIIPETKEWISSAIPGSAKTMPSALPSSMPKKK